MGKSELELKSKYKRAWEATFHLLGGSSSQLNATQPNPVESRVDVMPCKSIDLVVVAWNWIEAGRKNMKPRPRGKRL